MSWNYLNMELPPIGHGRFSPKLWVALGDGRVVPGQCLHPPGYNEGEKLKWFIEPLDGQRSAEWEGDVLAWQLIAPPKFVRPELTCLSSKLSAGDIVEVRIHNLSGIQMTEVWESAHVVSVEATGDIVVCPRNHRSPTGERYMLRVRAGEWR